MNVEEFLFAYFSVPALTLNFGFFFGEPDNHHQQNAYQARQQ
jgi:hypothetical protein